MTVFSLFGKLLNRLIEQKSRSLGFRYNAYNLALESKIQAPHLSRVMRGQSRISADLVNRLCDALGCDESMREALLNAAGHASIRQQERAARFLDQPCTR